MNKKVVSKKSSKKNVQEKNNKFMDWFLIMVGIFLILFILIASVSIQKA